MGKWLEWYEENGQESYRGSVNVYDDKGALLRTVDVHSDEEFSEVLRNTSYRIHGESTWNDEQNTSVIDAGNGITVTVHYDDDSLKEDLFDHMCNGIALNTTTMNSLMSLFLDYVILGGMPEVVAKYYKTNSFSGTYELQKQIIAAYKEDIRKYVEGADQTRIARVFDAIPVQLAKENKKFQISKIASGARFHDYGGCIDWLQDAGIAKKCYCLNFPELPLKGNYDDSKFKLYFSDSGLLSAMLDEESQMDLRANKNLGVYKGAIYESIVGEALYKQGYSLYYYKREDGTLEEDFFIRNSNDLIPLEVKSHTGRSQSMRSLINNSKYEDIKWGIKLSSNNIGYDNNLWTFPYFCTFIIKDWVNR